jgi:hypothetical protein
MFGKKKNEVFDTANDLLVKRIANELAEAHGLINERVEKVMIRIGVIELYPEGADKEKAKVDAEKAKQSLLNAVAVYDDAACRYNQAIIKDNRKTTLEYRSKSLTSHEIVEKAYAYIRIKK